MNMFESALRRIQSPMILMGLAMVAIIAAMIGLYATKSTTLPPSSQHVPEARQGVLDLSGWDYTSIPHVSLDGEWAFYWNQLLGQTDMQSMSPSSPVYVRVPASWDAYSLTPSSPFNEGVATYRLQFALPSSLTDTNPILAVYPKSIASAYRMWINGQLIGGNGIVGTDGTEEQPKGYPLTFYFQPREGLNEMIIQVSNFSQRNAGIWQSIEMGTSESIGRLRVLHVAAQSFIVGIFMIMALYFSLLYIHRRKEISALLFSVLCFSVGVRTVVLGETTALYLLPGFPWEWGVKAEYISVALTAWMLILFISREYPREAMAWAPKVGGFILGGFILFFLLSPARIYTHLLSPFTWGALFPALLYTLYVSVLSVVRRRKGSMISMVGFFFFTVFALNDMLFYTAHLPTEDMLSIGLLIFLLTQAYNLSTRFSRAMHATEQLSLKLRESNRVLEHTVQERTQSLQESNAQLQEMNRKMADFELFRARLLSNISHELSTPITSIKGFAKALRDGIITTEAPKYADRIYARSLLLEQMIHDLTELTKLETNQVKFQMNEVPLFSFMKDLFEKYEWEIEEHGIECQVRLFNEPMAHKYMAKLDPIRIEQVVSNLISNALKFTDAPGRITLHAEVAAFGTGTALYAYIGVTDTGVGVPPDLHEHIFERFGQARQPGRQEQGGAGLGLAICKEIVYYHGGDIGVNSEPGKGSEFYFKLPVWKESEAYHD